MKRILIIAATLVLILIAGAITAPLLIPSSVYRAQIEKSATTALGRDVKLSGETKLSVFPVISVRIGGAQVANPEGFTGEYMIDAGELKGSVKLLPLLSRKVEISQITLSDASINLEKLQDGRANWEFGRPGTAPDETPDDPSGGGFKTGIAKAVLRNTAISYQDRAAKQEYILSDFNGEARLTALDSPFSSKGSGLLNGQAFAYNVDLDTIDALLKGDLSTLDLDLETTFGDVGYNGSLQMGEVLQLSGAFKLDSDTIGDHLAVLLPDLPIRSNELQSVKANGTLDGALNALNIQVEKADLQATGLDASYQGGVQLGETVSLDGRFAIDGEGIDRLFTPDAQLPIPLAVLGKLNVSGRLSGPVSAPIFSDLSLTQSSSFLKTSFEGDVALSGDQAVAGNLDINSRDMRGLMNQLAIDLPPGDKLQSFAIDGAVNGTASNILLTDVRIKLDDTSAAGKLGADLRGARPRITADLVMSELDVTPLLGNSDKTAASAPNLASDWNDDPLALESLNMLNATVDIAASKVIIDQITLDDALLKTRLDDGRLSAIFRRDENKPGFKAFSGNWSGDIVLDASRSTPRLEIEAMADSVAAQDMLDSLTGFDRLLGLGDVLIDVSSEGNSLKALVSGLDGRLESDLSNGALRGINLAKLVRDTANLSDLLKRGDLSLTSFREAFSPSAETDFSSFIGNLTFDNGVAQISDLKLDNPVVGVTGSGSINLAARSLDISLTPRFDLQAQRQGSTIGVDDIPIPVRISGAWTAPKFSFDTRALQNELTLRARGRLADEIAGQVDGPLGNVLGEVIGGLRSPPAQPQTTPEDTPDSNAATTPPESPPKSIEDELKDRAIDGALGAIFGNQDAEEEPQTEQPAETADP